VLGQLRLVPQPISVISLNPGTMPDLTAQKDLDNQSR